MNLAQRLTLIIAAIVALLGSLLIILFFNNILEGLIGFYVALIVPTYLIYAALQSTGETSETPVQAIWQTSYTPPETTNQQNQELLVLKSFWIFDLFPDTMVIQENNITIIYKKFFYNSAIYTIPYSRVTDINLYTGPIFASLAVVCKDPPENYEMKYLIRKDAVEAKKIIDGILAKDTNKVQLPEPVTPRDKRKILKERANTQTIDDEIEEKPIKKLGKRIFRRN